MKKNKEIPVLNFDELYNRYYDPACSFARKFLINTEDAKDLVSDVFVNFWIAHEEMKSRENIRGFILFSTKHACLNYKDKKCRHEGHHDIIWSNQYEEELNTNWLDAFCTKDLLGIVNKQIRALPMQPKKVLTLDQHGMKTSEIAINMKIKIQTVRNTRNRGIGMLASALASK